MTKLGIVKSYLKFKLESLFGVIGCDKSNITYLPNLNGSIGSICMVGCAEDVIIWNMKTNEIVKTIPGPVNDKVTFLSYFNSDVSGLMVSIGYESGYVSVYSLWKMEKLIHLKCHKHPISYIIHCKPYGDRIICGSKDTSITVIDVMEEKGFELSGHASPITKLHYIWEKDVLISSSQDGNIKFWTIEEHHCFKTLFNSSPVWDFHYSESQNLLITGSDDALIRMWKLNFNKPDDSKKTFDIGESLTDVYSNLIQAIYLGDVKRNSPKRIVEMKVDKEEGYLICNTAEKKMELYKILTETELKKKLKKKAKKATKLNSDPSQIVITSSDRLSLISLIEFPSRVKAVDLFYNVSEEINRLEFLCSMHNNTLAVMHFGLPNDKGLILREHVSQPGHRTAIIHCQFTSDSMGLFTVSLSEAKLWERSSNKCLFTLGWSREEQRNPDNKEEYSRIYSELNMVKDEKLEASSALLLTGDRHALIGYKNGAMFLFNLVNGTILQSMKRHETVVSSLILSGNGKTILSGSGDKHLQTWTMECDTNTKQQKTKGSILKGHPHLSCVDGSSSVYKNGISCLTTTWDNKLVVIGFLDNKIRTYLSNDTTKRILDLHGHTEPATCLSIKYDNTQILSGSTDKTVRTWNLPFGDCKIFRGHRDAVTDAKFIPGRSMAFSADKSSIIIQWDTRNMSEITRLVGHGAQITCLAIESNGTEKDEEEVDLCEAQLVSVSTDCSIRSWYESEEITSKQIEQLDNQEREFEKEDMVREEIIIVGAPRQTETNILTKKTFRTEDCTDELIEAMDLYDKMKNDPRAVPDEKMKSMNHSDVELYMLDIVRRIKSGDLEFSLGQLPLRYVTLLLEILAGFVRRDREILLSCRCLLFLVKMHYKAVTINAGMVAIIEDVAKYAPIVLTNYENLLGFNTEAFNFFKSELGPELLKFTDKRKVAKSKSKKNK